MAESSDSTPLTPLRSPKRCTRLTESSHTRRLLRSHRTDREEFWRHVTFASLPELRKPQKGYMTYYNEKRPHHGIGLRTPKEQLKQAGDKCSCSIHSQRHRHVSAHPDRPRPSPPAPSMAGLDRPSTGYHPQRNSPKGCNDHLSRQPIWAGL